jgi:hypothetical protein
MAEMGRMAALKERKDVLDLKDVGRNAKAC